MTHPDLTQLKESLDGELSTEGRSRIEAHLRECARCRVTMEWLAALPRNLRHVTSPTLPSTAWEGIRERAEGGERLVLPAVAAADPPAEPSGREGTRHAGDVPESEGPRTRDGWRAGGWRAMAIAASVVLAAAAVLLVFEPPPASAVKGELRFEPAAPPPGAHIRATYHPDASLAAAMTLRLRARLRTPGDEAYGRGTRYAVLADLVRRDDGSFAGEFTLPDSVVYAVVAVEDTAAEHIDTNDRRLWELLVHDAEGKPTFEALEQRAEDLLGRNWELAHETARELVRLYPDRPASWNLLHFFQRAVLPAGELDSVAAEHRERLHAFDAAYDGRVPLTGDEMATLLWYARGLGDSALERKWRDRLLAEAPGHTLALQERIVFGISPDTRQEPEWLLPELERLWSQAASSPDRSGPGFSHLVRFGFSAAVDVGDRRTVERWLARYLEVFPDRGRYLWEELVERAEFQDAAIDSLRAALHRSESPSGRDRPLEKTRSEYRRWLEQPRQRLLLSLARAALDAGDTVEATRLLDRALLAHWSPRAFREIAEIGLSVGDTRAAGLALSRMAVDPAVPTPSVDSFRARLGEAIPPATWEDWTRAARTAMGEQILAGASDRVISRPIRIEDRDGKERRLTSVAAGRPLAVVFWSHQCGPAIEAVPAIERVAAWLEERGGHLILVTGEEPSPDLERFMVEHEVRVPLYFDRRRQAQAAFQNFGTPTYYLLDASGQVVFEGGGAKEIPALPRQFTAMVQREAVVEGG